jgi:hypothetical protein
VGINGVDTVMCFKAERRQHGHDAEHLREERIASERRYAEAKRQREASEEMLRRAEDQLAVLQDRSHGLLTPPPLLPTLSGPFALRLLLAVSG